MNAAAKWILVGALLALAVALLILGGRLATVHTLGPGVLGAAGSTGGALGEYGGYLILTLINVGLGTVVAWMLLGKNE